MAIFWWSQWWPVTISFFPTSSKQKWNYSLCGCCCCCCIDQSYFYFSTLLANVSIRTDGINWNDDVGDSDEAPLAQFLAQIGAGSKFDVLKRAPQMHPFLPDVERKEETYSDGVHSHVERVDQDVDRETLRFLFLFHPDVRSFKNPNTVQYVQKVNNHNRHESGPLQPWRSWLIQADPDKAQQSQERRQTLL